MTSNLGLLALTTEDEFKEVSAVGQFTAPNHDPNCKTDHLVLKFAYQMMGFLNWHVIRHSASKKAPTFKFAQSTLSMEGLKDWGLI
jgi:hypothetical protein